MRSAVCSRSQRRFAGKGGFVARLAIVAAVSLVAVVLANPTISAQSLLSQTIALDTGDGHWSPWGVWSDGTTMWVTDRPVGDARLYAYDLATGDHQSDSDILTLDEAGNDNASGIWSDGTTIWVSDYYDDRIYAYDLASGDRRADQDMEIDGTKFPSGIWSDGATMWVIDDRDDEIHGYDLASGERRADQDIDSLPAAGNMLPRGLWSDGATAWVPDDADDSIYAYDLATGVRQPDLDFDALWTQEDGGSYSPMGIWSDGASMWVVDSYQFKVFSYDMPAIAALSSLQLDGVDFDFAMAKSEYTPRVTQTTTSTTVTAAAAQTGSSVEISPADADEGTDGHQINLSPGDNTITVTVANGQASRVYTVTVDRTAFDTISDDATLSSVTLVGIDFGEFDSATTRYVLTVPSSVSRTKVTAASADENAAVTITPQDSTPYPGHQVDIEEGANSIAITVESSDGTQEMTYDITVNRASDSVFGWNAVKDINPTDTSDDLTPQGIWSDGTTMWVVDYGLWDFHQQFEVLAFDLADGTRRSDDDITGLGFWSDPRGIWSDETTVWISDFLDLEILAYDLATGVRQAGDDISRSRENDSLAHGLWSDGETIWVADYAGGMVYAYDLETGSRQSDLDVDILAAHGRNLWPTGIWSDGATMWVADDLDDRIYAHSLGDGTHQAYWDFDLALGNDDPSGLWSDGETMWVADADAGKVFAYNLPDTTAAPPTLHDTHIVLGDELSFGFSERLDRDSVPEPAAFTVTVNGLPRDVSSVRHGEFAMSLTLASAVASGDTVTLGYTIPTGSDAKPLRSAESGLPLASFAGLPILNETPPPVLTSATVDRTSITLDFNLPLRSSMPEPTAFAVTVNGTAREVSGVSLDTHGINGARLVFLGLASTVRSGDTVTVGYTVPTGPDANPLRGRGSGIAVASFAGVAVAYETSPPPTLQSATVDGSQLDLYFDNPVHYGLYSGGWTPAPDAFAVMVNGTAREVSSVFIAGHNWGRRFRVSLTLASAVTAGDTVTVGYTIPTGAVANPLMGVQDPVASFAGEAVTNETAPPANNTAPTGRVTMSGIAQVGETLTADVSGIADADGLTGAVFSYQWVRDDGTGESDIAGATSSTYTLVDADQGNTVKVRVNFTDDANNSQTNYSAATDEVAAAPPPTPPTPPTPGGSGFVVGDDMSFGFSERLDPTSVPEPAAFTVTVNGVPRSVSLVAHRTFSMGLRLASPVRSGDTVTLGYTVPTGTDAKPLQSAESGLLMASFAGLPLKNGTPPPVPTSALINRTYMLIDFNLNLMSNSGIEPTAFTVTVNGTASEVSSAGTDRGSPRLVGVSLASTVRNGDTVTVGYTVPTGSDANPLRGSGFGLEVASFEGLAVTNETDPPPTMQRATVDGSQLDLYFDHVVNRGRAHGYDGSPPAPEAFTVMVNGTAREVSSLYIATQRTHLDPGWRVTLTLASAVTAGDAVTVGYTIPTGADAHPLMGVQYPVASFAGEAVTNETAPPAANTAPTGRVAISGTAQVGETLTADVSGIADADGLTGAVFLYQWVRSDGVDDVDIAGATGSSYSAADADGGHELMVRVGFSDDGGNSESLTSDSVAVARGPVWSASVTVGEDTSTLPASLGFSTYSRLGSLSERNFTAGGVRNRVHVLAERAGGLYLVLARELDSDFKLVIGDQEFLASDSSEPPSGAGNGRYWWQTSGLGWSAGDVLDVSITPTDNVGDGDVSGRPAAPPTAYVMGVPDSHDGSTKFSFRLYFSEDIPISFRTLKHHTIEVANGTVKKTKRAANGSDRQWLVTIEPDSASDVTISILTTTDCAESNAICAPDGRMLHNGIEFIVPWLPATP